MQYKQVYDKSINSVGNSSDPDKAGLAEWRKTLVQSRPKIESDLSDALAELTSVIESADAVKLFTAVIANTGFGPEESMSEATHGDLPAKIETLAYCAYPLFGGSKEGATPWHISTCINLLDKIMALRMILASVPKDELEPDPFDEIASNVRRHTEVVRGSAFPEQTSEEIISVQGHFDQWFKKRTGVSPIRAQAILWSIIHAEERAINDAMPTIRKQILEASKAWQKMKSKSSENQSQEERIILQVLPDRQTAEGFELASALCKIGFQTIPANLEDTIELEPIVTREEWYGLIHLIGMTQEARASMSDIVDVRSRPLFVLPNNRVVLLDISNALDALWESFERVAKKDYVFFSGPYQREKAKWLQNKTVDYLSRIFPRQNIYQNLTYPDPDKIEDSIAELDIAVDWGPFLILIEVKAKQFRMESQLGDIGRLRSDIKANVEDAFEQAKRAANYIEQIDKPEFTEHSTNRRLTLDKTAIRRLYLLTVSQHLLAGVATRLSMFNDLGLFRNNEYPLSLSIADVDVITSLSLSPDVFLHYIERRLATQRELLQIYADEMDFFGAYLQTRLQPARLWDREGVRPNAVALFGFSSEFDDWFAFKRGDRSTPPKIELEIPQEIQQVLKELRSRDDYAARWIAFALLDMPDSMLDAMARNLSSLRSDTLRPGVFRRWTHAESDIVISVVGTLDLPPEHLEERTKNRAVIEKYRHKATKSIGFGVMVTDKTSPFYSASWAEWPWEYDARMETALQNEPPFIPASGTKLPGRNDPCVCGSGKKFKKCCLPKIEAAKNLGL